MKKVISDKRQLYTRAERKTLAYTLFYLTWLSYHVRYSKICPILSAKMTQQSMPFFHTLLPTILQFQNQNCFIKSIINRRPPLLQLAAIKKNSFHTIMRYEI